MWEFFIRSLDASTIFTIAALGELYGQRSGILNVGIEGVMLFTCNHWGFSRRIRGTYLASHALSKKGFPEKERRK